MSGAVINDAGPERLRSFMLENNMKRNREENIDSKEPELDRRSILGLGGATIGASPASIAGSAPDGSADHMVPTMDRARPEGASSDLSRVERFTTTALTTIANFANARADRVAFLRTSICRFGKRNSRSSRS
jgi:hypothetical protein